MMCVHMHTDQYMLQNYKKTIVQPNILITLLNIVSIIVLVTVSTDILWNGLFNFSADNFFHVKTKKMADNKILYNKQFYNSFSLH